MSAPKIEKEEEGIKKLQTVGMKTMSDDDFDNSEARRDLEDMDKKELVKLIINMGKNQLRHSNYDVAKMNERKSHFRSALNDIQKSIDMKLAKAKKYKGFGNDPAKTIKALEKANSEDKKEIEVLQKKVKQFTDKKMAEEAKQFAAKEKIDKKLVKKTYKFLEKDTHPALVTVLEVYVAQLRHRDRSAKEDVELYLRKFEGLSTSMAKLDTRDIPGEYLKGYTSDLDKVKGQFREGSENEDYIPYFDFANYTNKLLALSVEEKQIESEIHVLEKGIREKEKEIDEIETFRKDVDEVIDYQDQAEEEKKQFHIMQEHYNLLNLRAKKIGKTSKFFEKYFFRELKEKKKLRSSNLEKIDIMDDLDNVEDIEDQIEEIDVDRAITKVEKDDKDHNPLGDQQVRAKTLLKKKSVKREETKKAKKETPPTKVDDVKVKLDEKKKTLKKEEKKVEKKDASESADYKSARSSAQSSDADSDDDQSNEDSSDAEENESNSSSANSDESSG